MPWHLEERGGQTLVVNADTGKVMGRHASRAKAQRQLRALYANVPEAAEKSLFTVLKAQWDSAKHPRDRRGRFAATPDQIDDAIEEWANEGYLYLNAALRGTWPMSSKLAALRDTLDAAFETDHRGETLDKPFKVYRGVSEEFATAVRAMKVGTVFTDKGFVSVTPTSETAVMFAELGDEGTGLTFKLELPVGLRILRGYSGEHEWILRRNTKFRVVEHVDKDLVRLEVVP